MSNKSTASPSQASADKIPKQTSIADSLNDQETTPIFKLTVDCCDEIFEYLSLEDLHSMSQTCKAMQNVTGQYFMQNYGVAENMLENEETYIVADEVGVMPYELSYVDPDENEVHIPTTNFVPFIKGLSKYWGYRGSFDYIQSHAHDFKSINHIYLAGFEFAQHKVEIIKTILAKVETVQLRSCLGYGDLYEEVLKFCENMKRLYIQRSDLGEFEEGEGLDYTDHHRWMLRNYPKLEFVELIPEHSLELRELGELFRHNSTLHSFSSSIQCIWTNRNALLKSDIKLDTLEVKIFDYYFRNSDNTTFHIEEIVSALRNLFDQLFNRGFYKRLHLYVADVDEQASKFIVSLKGVEKLLIKEYDQIFDLPQLSNLKELAIYDGAKAADMEIFANTFTNLQRLYVCNASLDDIWPFIRRSPTLNKIKVFAKDNAHFNGGILPLSTLNDERAKLLGARKITIYVADNIFLNTKWKTENGNINLKLIEMKRVHSIDWNQNF